MNYITPESFQHYKDIIDNHKLVVCMYTTKFCAPCKKIKPEFKKLAKIYNDVVFVEVNLENIAVEDIHAVPCFAVYKDSQNDFQEQGIPALKRVQVFLDYLDNKQIC